MLEDLRSDASTSPAPRHWAFHLAVNDGDGWYLPGEQPRRSVAPRARSLLRSMRYQPDRLRFCPFCHTQMRGCNIPHVDHEVYQVGDSDVIGFGLYSCPRCAHWKFWSANYVCMDPPRYVVAKSVAAQFSSDLPDGCATELARGLRQHAARWHSVSHKGLERFVADIFRANYWPCEVLHVGGVADGGIDVMLINTGSAPILIQVKRRASSKFHEPVRTIRELIGTVVREDSKVGVVVSTATGFTRPSWREVEAFRKRGFVVELVDRSMLDLMLGPLLPRRPWSHLFRRPELDAIRDEVCRLVEGKLQPDQLTVLD